MRTHRFFCENLHTDCAALDVTQSRHLSKVLRLPVGAPVEVFDGRGLLAEGVVERLDREQAVVRLLKQTQVPPKTSGRVILATSLAKGERFDWMIEKCTELGVDHIAAVQYDRTVKLGKQATLERARKIALAAAKQCGRLHLPTLTGPSPLPVALADLSTRYPEAQRLYGDADGPPPTSLLNPDNRPDRIICIGPEGGFSDAERQFFTDHHARPVCINANILRIETAATAFAALFCLNFTSEIL